MADLAVTAANVVVGANAVTEDGTFGATVLAGELVYKDATDSNKWKLADANLSAVAADVYGVALNGGSNNQPGRVQTSGEYTSGATNVVGAVYVGSKNAGKIAAVADLLSGDFTKVWAVGKTAAILTIVNKGAGVAVP